MTPLDLVEIQERKEEQKKEELFDFGDSHGAFPHTIDIGHHLNKQAPDELFMTDTNLLEMRVPNFSFTGDLQGLEQ